MTEKTMSPAVEETGYAGHDHAHGIVEEASLDMLGLSSPLEKNMTIFETISVGWVICVSFAGVSGTMSLTIANGGPPALLYGLILVFVCMGASAGSLAELASVYPTAGGQYHWTSILAPKQLRRGLSYTCGAVNVFAWISLCSGFAAVISQFAVAMIIFHQEDYTPQPWHSFVMYSGVTLILMLYNMFLLKRSPWINIFAFCFTLSVFVVILVTCAARAHSRQDSATVWSIFVNESGWSSDTVIFFIGMASPNYMYAGLDGAIHLAEDCKNASIAVPRALMYTVIIGFVTSFPFIITLLYTTSDFESVLGTPTGVPVYEIFRQACASDAAATAFVFLILWCGVFATIGGQQTASRLTWSFARDNALVGSRWIGKVSPTWGVPIVALAVNAAAVIVIGSIALGSSAAFNAFIGSGLILQQLTYAIPAALLILQRRNSHVLPPNRRFKMRGLVGWAANLITVFFAVIVLIFYNLPVTLPVTSVNMNYTVAVLGGIAFASALNWVFFARSRYHGPVLED